MSPRSPAPCHVTAEPQAEGTYDVLSIERSCRPVELRPPAPDHLLVALATPPGRRRSLAGALEDRGIRVVAVGSLHELRRALHRLRPDIVIVDLDVDRADLLGFVRTAGAPLIATSVTDPTMRVELLLAGADDCLPALFAPAELAARVVAIVRRACSVTTPEPAPLTRSGPLWIDVPARQVRVHESEVFLTCREFDLLSYFVQHPGQTLPRDRLLVEVWGYSSGDTSTVTVHVRRLRAKVEADPTTPQLIQTVWGVGYRFCADGHKAAVARTASGPLS